MFSVDHPFANSEQATTFLQSAPVSESDREKIAHSNVEALLGI
jgi:predicted TIM-barrel fold metal-dependent hydrolase